MAVRSGYIVLGEQGLPCHTLQHIHCHRSNFSVNGTILFFTHFVAFVERSEIYMKIT